MNRSRKPSAPATLGECGVGDVVSCPLGTLRVGPEVAGHRVCRHAERVPGTGEWRECSEPVFCDAGIPVQERYRGAEWYARSPGGREFDPLIDADPLPDRDPEGDP